MHAYSKPFIVEQRSSAEIGRCRCKFVRVDCAV